MLYCLYFVINKINDLLLALFFLHRTIDLNKALRKRALIILIIFLSQYSIEHWFFSHSFHPLYTLSICYQLYEGKNYLLLFIYLCTPLSHFGSESLNIIPCTEFYSVKVSYSWRKDLWKLTELGKLKEGGKSFLRRKCEWFGTCWVCSDSQMSKYKDIKDWVILMFVANIP